MTNITTKTNDIFKETLKEIPTSMYMWLPCKKCNGTIRHILLNPDDCKECATYGCFYCLSEFKMARQFYQLYYGCHIDENDTRIVYDKK